MPWGWARKLAGASLLGHHAAPERALALRGRPPIGAAAQLDIGGSGVAPAQPTGLQPGGAPGSEGDRGPACRPAEGGIGLKAGLGRSVAAGTGKQVVPREVVAGPAIAWQSANAAPVEPGFRSRLRGADRAVSRRWDQRSAEPGTSGRDWVDLPLEPGADGHRPPLDPSRALTGIDDDLIALKTDRLWKGVRGPRRWAPWLRLGNPTDPWRGASRWSEFPLTGSHPGGELT